MSIQEATEEADEARRRGSIAFGEHRYEDAIIEYTEALWHDPGNHTLLSNRSAAYAAVGNFPLALRDGEHCVRLRPDWLKGYHRRGFAEFYLKNYKAAEQTYQAGLHRFGKEQGLLEGLRRTLEAKLDLAARKIQKQWRKPGPGT